MLGEFCAEELAWIPSAAEVLARKEIRHHYIQAQEGNSMPPCLSDKVTINYVSPDGFSTPDTLVI